MSLQDKARDVLENPELCTAFEEYLMGRWAWENFAFYMEAIEFAKIEDKEALKEKAQIMYDKYIEPDAAFELGNVEPEMRTLIVSCLNNPPRNMFKPLQQSCFICIAHTLIPEFKIDPIYKKWERMYLLLYIFLK